MKEPFNPEIVAFIDQLAETRSNYRLDEMKDLYAEDPGFLFLAPDGKVARFSKQEMLDELRSRSNAGEAPLPMEKRILHVEEQADEAVAILYRRMSSEASAVLYELRLKKADGSWRVSGETVLPWPDLETANWFLPPRRQPSPSTSV
jgi:hypothetical protein